MMTIGSRREPLHPDAVGFTLFRELPDGRGRQFTAVEFSRGWSGADWFLRQASITGIRTSTDARAYGLLDALDANGEVVQTYDVPDARSFGFIRRKLNLRVAFEGGKTPVRAG